MELSETRTRAKKAVLYRMVTPEHICPYGTRSKFLLEHEGFEVEDHLLRNRAETEDFKAKNHVSTTPQTFIDGRRVGGYDDLQKFLGHAPALNSTQRSYAPVLCLFAVGALMAIVMALRPGTEINWLIGLRLFMGFSVCLLATQKLRDLDAFANSFLNYDLLSLRYVPYATIYPFAELLAGLGMLNDRFGIATAVIAIPIGIEGFISVFKAVFVDRRNLVCACVGGNSKVPLGFLSLTENAMMIVMGFLAVT